MKIGCASWCFAAPRYQAPYEDAIEAIAALGFQAIEMIAFHENDVEQYYTPAKIKELRRMIGDKELELSQFAIYTGLTGQLASMEEAQRQEGLAYFKRVATIGRELGAPMINMVSNWPMGYTCPVDYPPNYWAPFVGGPPRRELTQNMTLPPDFDGEAAWKRYMETLRECLIICRDLGMRFNLEGHANVIVPGTGAMMRMLDQIPDEDFGINFDTAWHMIQREYLPMSIRTLKERIFHVHLRDGDGILNYDLPPQYGITNWIDTLGALKQVGFDGVLSFEMTGFLHPDQVLRQAKGYIQEVLAAL